LPQIDVFKTSKNKGNELESGIHTLKNKAVATKLSTIPDVSFNGQYFIYSLEWSEKALIWSINGTEVHRETENIPDEQMYLTFCITLPDVPKSGQLPANMEIDWVRCYKKV
jgi:beta-glucanase (GH16 family)